MKLLFAAGDVGGARALLPVARLAAAKGMTVCALDHGTFRTEGAAHWHWLTPTEAAAQAGSADVVLYATSVNDTLAIQIAQHARAAGRPVLHLLDNWSNYAARIATLVPDVYAVMDDLAMQEAIAEGVDPTCLVIAGHPDIAKLAAEAEVFGAPQPNETQPHIFFASEPAAIDGGPRGRGYDENEVARILIDGIAQANANAANLTVKVAPHPRQNREAVRARFVSLATEITGAPKIDIVAPEDVRSTLHSASHVAGMTSILLYEAWLLGRPTLSLQPGLSIDGLRTLSQRNGIIFHSAKQGGHKAIADWLSLRPRAPLADLVRHQNAAQIVLDISRDLATRSHRSPNQQKTE
jgi:hypothetical protein